MLRARRPCRRCCQPRHAHLIVWCPIPSTHATLYLARELEGALHKEALWSQDDPRFVLSDTVSASLASAPDGTGYVTQLATSGLVLHSVADGKVSHFKLVPDDAPPLIVVDRSGAPHVFDYALDELHHVFRGSCP